MAWTENETFVAMFLCAAIDTENHKRALRAESGGDADGVDDGGPWSCHTGFKIQCNEEGLFVTRRGDGKRFRIEVAEA